jgi:ABC-type uncharacterized transport system substrate-binding protein
MSNGLHEFAPRSLRLFKEIMPEATHVGILAPAAHRQMGAVAIAMANALETVTHALDLVPRTYYATTANELRNVLAGLDRRTDVLFVHPEHGLLLHRTTIIAAAMALKIPVVCQQPEYVIDGALLSLNADRREIYRRIPYFVDAILKGARPSDLPVEEPSKSWLMLNLRTAKLLGIDIPGPILMCGPGDRVASPRARRSVLDCLTRVDLYQCLVVNSRRRGAHSNGRRYFSPIRSASGSIEIGVASGRWLQAAKTVFQEWASPSE